MRQPAIDQTFDMKAPRDMLDKLEYERRRLHAADLDLPKEVAYITINGAITAWHLCDWVFEAAKGTRQLAEIMGGAPQSVADVQEWARARCPALAVCDHLANAAKHFERGPGKLDPDLETVVEWYRFHKSDGSVDVFLAVNVRHGNQFPDPRALLEHARDFWSSVVDQLERP